MKLKFYLRGLGIGIFVTALILTLSGMQKKEMTDEEIIQRAKELGMTESTTLAELESHSEELNMEEPTDTISTEEVSFEEEISEVSATEEATTEEVTTEEMTTEEMTAEVTPKQEAATENLDSKEGSSENEYVTVTINKGDGSDTVSRKVFEAGLVESAADYDRFLCQNGYDKKLQAGNHQIMKGATNEDIANALIGH